MAEQVKLYGTWASPFSLRVELALKLKGVPYEYFEEDLQNKSPSLLKYNPVHKKIPVLVHNGKPIAESLVILEYIDETWKNNPILPKDPYQKAQARFWAKFIDEKVLETGMKANFGDEKERQKLMEELFELYNVLEGELDGKDFFGGETIGYVDIAANVIAFWFTVAQEALGSEFITEESHPILFKWSERLEGIEVVKETIPPRDKHIAHVKARFEAIKVGYVPQVKDVVLI